MELIGILWVPIKIGYTMPDNENGLFLKVCKRVTYSAATLAALVAIFSFSYKIFAQKAVEDTAKSEIKKAWVFEQRPEMKNQVDSVSALILSKTIAAQNAILEEIKKIQCYQQAGMNESEMRRGEQFYELSKGNHR